MLGAWEMTAFGNVFMGIMAIGGVCCMVYAVGTSMTNPGSAEQGQLEDTARDERKNAA